MISILAVNYNSLEWMRLLVKSVRKFTTVPYEIIVFDNASVDGSVDWLKAQTDIKTIVSPMNYGHGHGLDRLLKEATHAFCLVLDSDAHIMRRNWDYDILDLYHSKPTRRLIAAKGGDLKPIHPCVMFFRCNYFRKEGLKFSATREHDVGRKLYYDITDKGYEVFGLNVGYEKPGVKFYEGVYGDIYYINRQPTFYHNWYSSRMWKRDKVDSLTREEFERRKDVLFGQPLVKEIICG